MNKFIIIPLFIILTTTASSGDKIYTIEDLKPESPMHSNSINRPEPLPIRLRTAGAASEDSKYVEKIVPLIKEQYLWTIPDNNNNEEIIIKIDIAENGIVSNVDIVRSSDNPKYDEAAIEAILKASPLPRPPHRITNLSISF